MTGGGLPDLLQRSQPGYREQQELDLPAIAVANLGVPSALTVARGLTRTPMCRSFPAVMPMGTTPTLFTGLEPALVSHQDLGK